MLFTSWLSSLRPAPRRPRSKRPTPCRLQIEPLEDRSVPASGLSASLVADILPGIDSSNPVNLSNVNGTLFFSALNASGGQVMKSDGTAAGTVGLANIYGSNFTPLNGSVFFRNDDGLWKTDGTAAGTVLVKSVERVQTLAAVNRKLFFTAWDDKTGRELWVSDGTAAGTGLLKDIYKGSRIVKECDLRSCTNTKYINTSDPSWLTNLNGTLMFTAYDDNGQELWKSDGTARGTTLVKDIVPGPTGSNPQYLEVVNGVAYFGAAGGLWRSDGTSAGTLQLKTFAGSPSELTDVNGTLCFNAGGELWKSDGTAAGTARVLPDTLAYDPQSLAAVNDTLFFNAWTSSSGRELWKSDGTTAGTVLVKDINPGAAGSNPGGLTHDSDGLHFGGLTNVNGLVYFAAGDAADERGNPTNVELWQSDGTAAGTVMVQDIYPGSTGSDPTSLTAMNNKLYFAATDPVHGRELWDPPAVEPPQDYLLLNDLGRDQVLRYDAATGAFVDTFVPKHSGGMNSPWGVLFGPDGNLYVSTGMWGGPGQLKAVLRYDGTTGAFIDEFTKGGDLARPLAIIFGPDGNLYVGENTPGLGGRVARYDGRTGAYLGDFVPRRSGGLGFPGGMVFGPSGRGDALDLYVSSLGTDSVLRYDGTTGEFLGEFVASGTGGLSEPEGLTFGPDGNLYVASLGFQTSNSPRAVLRFQGPTGSAPGAFIDEFVPPGAGGLETPLGVLFGPDGNGDGNFDLYVSNSEVPGGGNTAGWGKNATVKRYDGMTGGFIDTFVTAGSGGLDDAQLMTFTRTDPVTLAYRGGDKITAASLPASTTTQTLADNQVQPLLIDALTRWQAAGVDTSAFASIDVRISNLSGMTLGLASGNTIWLDDNAAGWGWFVDPTPWDESKFHNENIPLRRKGLDSQHETARLHPKDPFVVLAHNLGQLQS